MTITQLISHYGNVSEAARKLRVTRQAIYFWKKHGIPRRTQAMIQIDTNGALKASK